MSSRRPVPLTAAVALSVAAAVALAPTAGRADEAPWHRVWIESRTPELELSVIDAHGKVRGRCRGGCVVELPAGEFALEVNGGDRFVSTRRTFEVEGPTSVEVSPGRSTPHVVGVVTAYVGAIACVAGLGLRMIAGFAERPTLEDARRLDDRAKVGGIMAIAGAVTFAIGLPLAIATRTTVSTQALEPESAGSVRVAFAPLPGGFALGLAGAF
jgi:hypothetical protein